MTGGTSEEMTIGDGRQKVGIIADLLTILQMPYCQKVCIFAILLA